MQWPLLGRSHKHRMRGGLVAPSKTLLVRCIRMQGLKSTQMVLLLKEATRHPASWQGVVRTMGKIGQQRGAWTTLRPRSARRHLSIVRYPSIEDTRRFKGVIEFF